MSLAVPRSRPERRRGGYECLMSCNSTSRRGAGHWSWYRPYTSRPYCIRLKSDRNKESPFRVDSDDESGFSSVVRSCSSMCPDDANQLAKPIAEIATGQAVDTPIDCGTRKNTAAAPLGWLGGNKGGGAATDRNPAERRSEAAQLAAQTRWAHRANHDD